MSDAGTAAGAGTGLVDRLGVRAQRRPSPRVGVTVAAAGSALVVVGALVESGNRLVDSSGDSPNRWPGVLLSAAVLAAGVFVLTRFRHGALAAAGVAATALAVPPLLFFLTIDYGSSPPFSTEAVLFGSSLVWLGFYAVGPARAHGLYLGAGLLGVWLFVLEEVEGLLTFPFALPQLLFGVTVDSSNGDAFAAQVPSASNLGIISFLFGVGYLVAARVFDSRRQHGIATPFTFVGLVALFFGILLLASDLHEVGTGFALVIAGFAVAALGAVAERRATTWTGGVAVFYGAAILAAKVADDNVDLLAIALVAAGALAVLLAHLFSEELTEPPETTPGPSALRRRAPTPTATAAPPAAAAATWGPSMPTEPPTAPPIAPPPPG